MTAGYSRRSAAEKLGVKPRCRLRVIGADDGWVLDGLSKDVVVRRDLRARCDVMLAFVRSAGQLRRDADRYVRALDDSASLWIAWPRRAAGRVSDVTEDLLREVFLPRDLVDVKVAAIDEDWSGLKFVRRKERRAE